MVKRKPIEVVYNHAPDPVVKITEYEYTGDGLKMVKQTDYKDAKQVIKDLHANKVKFIK